MRLVIQRVKSASLVADGVPFSQIGHGLLVMVGVCKTDTIENVKKTAKKIATMRIFEEDEKMNLSVMDVGGEVMLVSNFTLCTVETSGTRPDFGLSANKDLASDLYQKLAEELASLNVPVKTGVFAADMQIETVCDGPVTIVMDSNVLLKKKTETEKA